MILEADAVVVGAGALGLSTAFHLARFGVRRGALVDRFAPGSQTSARAAGQKVTRFKDELDVHSPGLRLPRLLPDQRGVLGSARD